MTLIFYLKNMFTKKKINKFLLFLLFFSGGINSQSSPAVYKIANLLNRIHNNSDTIYVVNFWATWCKPCIEELPDFEKFNRQNKTKIVKIILVSTDFKENLKEKVIPFLKKNYYSMECVLLDEINGNDFIDKINSKWSGAIPATYFTTKRKKKERLLEGKISLDLLNSTLLEFSK